MLRRVGRQGSQEGLEDAIRPPAAAASERLQRQGMREPGLVRAGGWERVVDVQDADDLGAERDLVALEAVGVAAAVVALVVPADDGLDVPREFHARQELNSPQR